MPVVRNKETMVRATNALFVIVFIVPTFYIIVALLLSLENVRIQNKPNLILNFFLALFLVWAR